MSDIIQKYKLLTLIPASSWATYFQQRVNVLGHPRLRKPEVILEFLRYVISRIHIMEKYPKIKRHLIFVCKIELFHILVNIFITVNWMQRI